MVKRGRLSVVLAVAALLLLASSLPSARLSAGDVAARARAQAPGLAWDPGDVVDASGRSERAALGVEAWLPLIQQAADDSGVPWQALAAIMSIESGGDPNALSPAGAVGLMQIMPAEWAAISHAYGDNIWDPWTNIRTAAAILGAAEARWGSWEQAAAAYFGALDAEGRVTDATDAYGTTGRQYVDNFVVMLATFGMGQSLDGLGDAGEAPAGEAIAAGLALALQQQGAPYAWGGASPELGFDCSGLVVWAYGQAGLQLPRTSAEQWRATRRLSAGEALPGDLVFFAGTDGPGVTHVAIYVGAGLMLDAPDVGSVVQLEDLSGPYWQAHLAGFGRVDPDYAPADPSPAAPAPAPATPDASETPKLSPATAPLAPATATPATNP